MATIPRPSPRERKGDRTRARLLEAAVDEFRRVGFGRASISRISEAAGLARSAFYFHFPTKADALREMRDLVESSYASRIASAETLSETLENLVDGILEARSEVGDPALFGEMLALETDPATSMPATATSAAALALVEQFSRAAERGELRPGLRPEHAAVLCLRSVFGCLVGGPRSLEECREDLTTVTSLFQREKGREARRRSTVEGGEAR